MREYRLVPTQTLSTKHPLLKKTVTYKILSNEELNRAFEYGIVIDFEGLSGDDQIPLQLLMDMIRERHEVDVDLEEMNPLYRVFEVLAFTVVNFDRHLDTILALDDATFSEVITDMYRTAIVLNPAWDFDTFKILRGTEPLGDDLEAAAGYLPSLDPAIAAHVGRIEGLAVATEPGMMFVPASVHDSDLDIANLTNEELLNRILGEAPAGADPSCAFGAEEAKGGVVELNPEKVKNLRECLAETVVGQKPAIEAVYSAIKRAAVGFRDENRPISVLLFAGPTGVGKTLLSEQTAKELFGESTVGRIDCAQLTKEYDLSKLLGPAPGYLGYPDVRPPMDPEAREDWDEEQERKNADPSMLWKAAKGMQNGGVLIIDEVEKAHYSIQDQFLTLFDEGYITTSVGNRLDFRNCLVVMTSNIGSREMHFEKTKSSMAFGFCPTKGDKREIEANTADPHYVKKMTTEAAKAWFKPEIMGRISLIVPFTDLSHEELLKVVDLEWKKSLQYLSKKIAAKLELGENLRGKIADISKGAGYGARLISRLIEAFVNDQLAEIYLERADVLEDESRTVTIEWLRSDDENEVIGVSINDSDVVAEFSISKTVIATD